MLGGVALGVVAVVAVVIAISASGGGSSGSVKTGTEATAIQAEVAALLGGIPQSGATLGNPSAPVTMVYYGDLECPICKDFTLQGGFPEFVTKQVRTGKAKVLYRSLQTATQNPQTFLTQQVAALAAGDQSHFWDYTELFYRQQGQEGTDYANEAFLTGLARQIPSMNQQEWRTSRQNPAHTNTVKADEQSASAAGINATPTLIMEGPKGKSQVPGGVPSYDQLMQSYNAVA